MPQSRSSRSLRRPDATSPAGGRPGHLVAARPGHLVAARPGHLVAAATLAWVLAAVAAASCSHDSFLVVGMLSADSPFTNLTEVVVNVTANGGAPTVTRTFVATGTAAATIDTATLKTLSVSFTPDRSGPVAVTVTVFDSSGSSGCVGKGATAMNMPAVINKGGTATVTVKLAHTRICTTTDGGTPDGPITFPGCNPAMSGACPGPQACDIDCTTRLGACVTGGTKAHGEACGPNDCMPGTQCFDFSCNGPGTGPKTCVKFCGADNDCAIASTPSGTSTCRDPVVCQDVDPMTNIVTPVPTTYRTCGFACDPRGDGRGDCPMGLTCFLYQTPAGGQDTPNCGCNKPDTRTGTDGVACASSATCAPGFICNMMNGTMACRKLCKMIDAINDCGTTAECVPLTNNTVFGVCVGS